MAFVFGLGESSSSCTCEGQFFVSEVRFQVNIDSDSGHVFDNFELSVPAPSHVGISYSPGDTVIVANDLSIVSELVA